MNLLCQRACCWVLTGMVALGVAFPNGMAQPAPESEPGPVAEEAGEEPETGATERGQPPARELVDGPAAAPDPKAAAVREERRWEHTYGELVQGYRGLSKDYESTIRKDLIASVQHRIRELEAGRKEELGLIRQVEEGRRNEAILHSRISSVGIAASKRTRSIASSSPTPSSGWRCCTGTRQSTNPN